VALRWRVWEWRGRWTHCTATHCNTLQHTATHCYALQHNETHCNMLLHTTSYRTHTSEKSSFIGNSYSKLSSRLTFENFLRWRRQAHGPSRTLCLIRKVASCVTVFCSVLQCVAVCCSVLQCVAACCSVLQYVVVCCSVLQCIAVCCSVGLIADSVFDQR